MKFKGGGVLAGGPGASGGALAGGAGVIGGVLAGGPGVIGLLILYLELFVQATSRGSARLVNKKIVN
jgi:hypothetical protein